MDVNKPVGLHDSEGTPPLPLELNDQDMALWGCAPQQDTTQNNNKMTLNNPSGSISYMVGFVVITKIFQILSGCQLRSRTFTHCPSDSASTQELLTWVVGAQARLDDILDGLPRVLQFRCRKTDGAIAAEDHHQSSPSLDDVDDMFGIQQANLCITTLCVRFALLDFKAQLHPDHQGIREERADLARQAYSESSKIPIRHLAANGESMRGKVLRVALDLLSMSSSSSDDDDDNEGSTTTSFGQEVWDWWNMYSQVRFLQLVSNSQNDNDGGDAFAY